MDWLYHDEPDGNRIFKKEVYLGKNAEPWPECTNEEQEQWQRYNYEASEGMILIGVPQDLRDLNYDSESDMAQIKQAVIVGDDKPDLTPRAFNADYKEYAEITLVEGKAVEAAWNEAHPLPEASES